MDERSRKGGKKEIQNQEEKPTYKNEGSLQQKNL